MDLTNVSAEEVATSLACFNGTSLGTSSLRALARVQHPLRTGTCVLSDRDMRARALQLPLVPGLAEVCMDLP